MVNFDAYYIDCILEQKKESEQVKCPHCGAIQPNDDFQYPVSYWGEEGPVEIECVECEKKFWVEESVERTYIVGKAIDKYHQMIEE
jgi:DNA-directed RNA polymerase subunit RPC12/RpoP